MGEPTNFTEPSGPEPCPTASTPTMRLWQTHASPLPHWQWDSYGRPILHPARVPSCSLGHTLGPVDCLCTAKLSPLPGSVHWSPSLSSPSLHTPVSKHLMLGSVVMWPGPSVVFLYPARLQVSSHTLFFSLWSSLSVLEDLPASKEGCQGEGTFPLSQLPPKSTGSLPVPPLLPFPFILLVILGSFLQHWSYEIYKLSVGILWELLYM